MRHAYRPWIRWSPLSDAPAPKGHFLVVVIDDLFAAVDGDALLDIITHSGGGVGASYIWDPQSVYITPTRHPARMRAVLRTWGGYDEEGRLSIDTRFRDFAENHVPALVIERQADLVGWGDLMITPAACRALILDAREPIDLSAVLESAAPPAWVLARDPAGQLVFLS